MLEWGLSCAPPSFGRWLRRWAGSKECPLRLLPVSPTRRELGRVSAEGIFCTLRAGNFTSFKKYQNNPAKKNQQR